MSCPLALAHRRAKSQRCRALERAARADFRRRVHDLIALERRAVMRAVSGKDHPRRLDPTRRPRHAARSWAEALWDATAAGVAANLRTPRPGDAGSMPSFPSAF